MNLGLPLAGLVIALLAAAACSDPPPQGAPPSGPAATGSAAPLAARTPAMRPVPVAEVTLPSKAPYLSTVLPAEALAYLRVPSLWGLLGTPKGGIYDRALGSAPHVAAVNEIRAGLRENLLPELPEADRALLALLLLHARSPIEALALPPDASGTFPRLLITAALDFPDPAAVNAFVLEASRGLPMLRLESPFDAKGDGELAVGPVLLPAHYAVADGRLFLLASEAKDPDALRRLLAGLSPAGPHKMKAVESRLESGGQGLFLWLDVPRALVLLGASGQEDQAAMLTAFGAGEVRSFGVGAGSSGGIHRIKLLLEMPPVGFRSFVPAVRSRLDVVAAGEPGALIQLGLPAPEDLASLEQSLQTTMCAERYQQYLQWKDVFKEKLGFSLEELLGTIGQDLSVLFDQAGSYAALRLRDGARFEALLGRAKERFGIRHETREVVGAAIHHVTLPAVADWSPPATAEAGTPPSPLEQRFRRLPSHLYFVQEGDYLLLASTPQTLIDRQYIALRTPVRQWLEEQQRLEPDGALLLATIRNRGAPAFLYDLNLQLLAFLGDLAGRPVDLFGLPSARELGLPEAGAYGLRVASTESELSVELAFEHNPAEVLMTGSGSTGIAVAGVLAAVAIPAYQDYTIRAQVAGGIAATEPLRSYLSEFVETNGRFPNAEELESLDLSQLQQPQFRVAVQPEEGRVLVTFDLEALEEANAVVLSPRVEQGGTVWECVSDIPGKYLPATCR